MALLDNWNHKVFHLLTFLLMETWLAIPNKYELALNSFVVIKVNFWYLLCLIIGLRPNKSRRLLLNFELSTKNSLLGLMSFINNCYLGFLYNFLYK